ncbi:hypothetical protein TWF696_002591 [Orbilia brochopaga]|uniref:DNA repair protein rhp7 treble clef domain-containing protein n=1 Tax=Orbilia brochopaga TaxID=3140254 RepID=A0AAV9U365_9PEZI
MTRRSGARGVRGPTSALTEFLRERGIDANEIRRRAEGRAARALAEATQAAQAASVDQDVHVRVTAQGLDGADDDGGEEEEDIRDHPAESSATAAARRTICVRRVFCNKGEDGENEDQVMADADDDEYNPEDFEDEQDPSANRDKGKGVASPQTADAAENSRKRRRSTTTITVNVRNLGIDDDDEQVAEASSSKLKKNSKPTKAQLKKLKKSEAKKAKKARRDAGEDVSDDDDNDFGPTTAAVPLPGQIAFCTECNCRFTVTPYTKTGPNGEGMLCHPCGKASAPVEAAARKRKQAARTTKKSNARALLDGERGGIKSLQELCIQLVAKHIDDVEALGNIGSYNMDKICQIISKNRSLTDHTMKLFLENGDTTLSLYDCYKIQPANFRLIAACVPTLRRLHLKYCGQMNDECLDYYGTQLKNLEVLELYGAFNVTEDCYVRFFKTIGRQLKEFGVSDTSRFRLAALNALVDNCPDLEVLRLRTLTHLDDQCIRLLTGLPNLTVLEISEPSMELTDKPIIDVLNTCGSGLKELNLNGCSKLTDYTLEAIHNCCGKLETLSISHLEMVTNEGLSRLFIGWDINYGLRDLNIERCQNLESSGFIRIIDHSGNTLERLSVNSCKELGRDDWYFFCYFKFKALEEIDLSMIRTVTDDVIEQLLAISPHLKVIKAWGCHKLTESVKLREDLHLIGREADILS